MLPEVICGRDWRISQSHLQNWRVHAMNGPERKGCHACGFRCYPLTTSHEMMNPGFEGGRPIVIRAECQQSWIKPIAESINSSDRTKNGHKTA